MRCVALVLAMASLAGCISAGDQQIESTIDAPTEPAETQHRSYPAYIEIELVEEADGSWRILDYENIQDDGNRDEVGRLIDHADSGSYRERYETADDLMEDLLEDWENFGTGGPGQLTIRLDGALWMIYKQQAD